MLPIIINRIDVIVAAGAACSVLILIPTVETVGYSEITIPSNLPSVSHKDADP